jgi:hypothetical protein
MKPHSFASRLAAYAAADPDGCWLWPGHLTTFGYGQVSDPKDRTKLTYAHRRSYEMLVGPIPVGMHIDHLCRNPSCINPKHLEPVTPRINKIRGVGSCAQNARKTHCQNGHPFSPENTLRIRNPGGPGRRCKECFNSARRRRWHAAKLDKAAS